MPTDQYLIDVRCDLENNEVYDYIQYLQNLPKDIKDKITITLTSEYAPAHARYIDDTPLESHLEGIKKVRHLMRQLKAHYGFLGNYDTLDHWTFGPDGTIIDEL